MYYIEQVYKHPLSAPVECDLVDQGSYFAYFISEEGNLEFLPGGATVPRGAEVQFRCIMDPNVKGATKCKADGTLDIDSIEEWIHECEMFESTGKSKYHIIIVLMEVTCHCRWVPTRPLPVHLLRGYNCW